MSHRKLLEVEASQVNTLVRTMQIRLDCDISLNEDGRRALANVLAEQRALLTRLNDLIAWEKEVAS